MLSLALQQVGLDVDTDVVVGRQVSLSHNYVKPIMIPTIPIGKYLERSLTSSHLVVPRLSVMIMSLRSSLYPSLFC